MGLSIKILVSCIDENIRMNTMSLYESSDSPGDIFLKNLCENRFESKILEETGLEWLAYLIVRGGWSANISVEIDKYGELALCYIENVIKTDLKQLDKDIDYNEHKDKLILKSLPPNESTTVSNQSVLRDIV